MISKNQIADMLRVKRLELGLTGPEVVRSLRQRCGIELSEKTLYGYERAVSSPNVRIFLSLCGLYGVLDPERVLSGSDFPFERPLGPQEETLLAWFRQATPEAQRLVLKLLSPEGGPYDL